MINIENFKRNTKYFNKARAINNGTFILPEPYDDLPITYATLGIFLFISQYIIADFSKEELDKKCND